MFMKFMFNDILSKLAMYCMGIKEYDIINKINYEKLQNYETIV